jgi:hypothetical protein
LRTGCVGLADQRLSGEVAPVWKWVANQISDPSIPHILFYPNTMDN